MGHLYPLATDAPSALSGAQHAAQTRAEAERLAGNRPIEALKTEWLTVEESDAAALIAQADRAVGDGFVQRYEDEAGRPVLAITYWALGPPIAPSTAKPTSGRKTATRPVAAPEAAPTSPPAEPEPDHTDDLYFKAGRTRKRKRRQRYVDPRQLDLFTGPDQQGFEHRDPHNPAVIITDEEGDGTTFGD